MFKLIADSRPLLVIIPSQLVAGWCLLFLPNLYLYRDRQLHILGRTKTGPLLGLWGAIILNKFWMWETSNVFVVTIVPPMTGDIFRNNLLTNIIICLRFVLDNTKDTIIIDVCYLFFHISSKIFLSLFYPEDTPASVTRIYTKYHFPLKTESFRVPGPLPASLPLEI